jgi:hypothetical protein
MSGGVKLDGVDELMRDLTHMPAEIRAEAMDIVRETTEGAASEITHTYPSRTGNLRNRIRTLYPASAALVGVIRSMAPHSHLFEFGTKQRQNKAGANRGRMPRADIFVPIVQKWRERMYTRLLTLLANKGFLVSER